MLIAKYFRQFSSLNHEQNMPLIVVIWAAMLYSLLCGNQHFSEIMLTTYKTTLLQHSKPLKSQMYQVLSKSFHIPFDVTWGTVV
jgi:hypothetical protein